MKLGTRTTKEENPSDTGTGCKQLVIFLIPRKRFKCCVNISNKFCSGCSFVLGKGSPNSIIAIAAFLATVYPAV